MLGFLFVTLLAIPLTIYLVQQQQETRSQATPNTNITFNPSSPEPVQVGDDLSFDIMLSPGSNAVTSVKLVIKYDSTKLSTSVEDFAVDPASNLTILDNPVILPDSSFAVTLSIGNVGVNKIVTDTKIGTIQFHVEDGPAEASQITLGPTSEAYSASGSDTNTEESVLQNIGAVLATVNIEDEEGTDISSGGDNTAPVCTSLTPNGAITGQAPYELSFTANGSDSDGTLRNFKFTFEPNEIVNIASDSSKATSVTTVTTEPHTYETEGSYVAKVEITDDKGSTNTSVNCTKTITVSAASGGTNNTANDDDDSDDDNSSNNATSDDDDSDSDDPTATPTDTDTTADDSENLATDTEISPSPMPATGPTEAIVGFGVLGGILFLIGTLLFFAL